MSRGDHPHIIRIVGKQEEKKIFVQARIIVIVDGAHLYRSPHHPPHRRRRHRAVLVGRSRRDPVKSRERERGRRGISGEGENDTKQERGNSGERNVLLIPTLTVYLRKNVIRRGL